ncbi:WD domain-containing protein, partial [Penicillium cosmopolitanum]
YFAANGLVETCASLRRELGSAPDIDETTQTRYESLLEKKWTSNSRLQRKIMELESRNQALQQELDNVTPASLLKCSSDATSWLPQRAKFKLQSHRGAINCIAFHPIFSSIASGADDNAIKVWDWEHGVWEATLKGHTKAVHGLDYGDTPNGVFLASCSSDLTIKLWDPRNGYKNTRTLQDHSHIVSAVRFIPSRDLLASASRDAQVKLWNTANGHCVKTIEGHTGWVRDIFPSAGGDYLLSTGDDRTVRLWDISSTQPENKMSTTGHENFIICCAIAPSETFQYIAPWLHLKKPASPVEFMATGSRDKTVKLWDFRGTCILTLIGHDNWVRAIAFHPGGKYLLSVSDDRTLRCWDLSQQGKCVKIISDSDGNFITCLKWAPSIANHAQSPRNLSFEQSKGNASVGSSNKVNGEGRLDKQIRCVVATGNANEQVKIYAE